MDNLRKRQWAFSFIYVLLAFAAMWTFRSWMPAGPAPKEVPYSELLQLVNQGKLAKAEVRDDDIVAELKPEDGAKSGQAPGVVVAKRLPRIDETKLLERFEQHGVSFAGRIERASWWQSFLAGWLLPMGLMLGIYLMMIRRVSSKGGPLNIGRSRAKIFDATASEKVTFADVAGVDEAEAELVEIVEFLKRPEKYQLLGARIPKGVLLVGPPGTGKTLLARAVAGEAGVPFFSMSASEFIEMFVGLGAARMRDLFEQAKTRAPCIIFIDELDAIGKSRGGLAALATHDEREQTLNQLLAEMDGFDPTKGVIIMAATNRPEVLDPALLRAGRFDRQVLVDRPDLKGREEILRVHVRKVKVGPSAELETLARRTPGMVGADLANVVNEAALAAGRRGSTTVEMVDFEEAIDRIQLGLKKKGRVMNEEEKRRVAYHEGGHALVAMSLAHADPVHRVTIIPRSIGALGATLQLPTEERYLMTKDELLDRICVMMGGRSAEAVIFEDTSTGAENDLERATEMARLMICRFGMSSKLGPVTMGRSLGARYLEGALPMGMERNFSEDTARAVDAEIRSVLESQQSRAHDLLERRRVALERIARALLERETIERAELEAILAEEAHTAGNGSGGEAQLAHTG
ncbi:MAG TPA: ATP-dependent zinc metalloprotease FtsH [Polyangia bacterium]|nr:ATP-dependent zinc metalloprotease FtsH [Polyangia bacterium]